MTQVHRALRRHILSDCAAKLREISARVQNASPDL
jgi:hypothetical protein